MRSRRNQWVPQNCGPSWCTGRAPFHRFGTKNVPDVVTRTQGRTGGARVHKRLSLTLTFFLTIDQKVKANTFPKWIKFGLIRTYPNKSFFWSFYLWLFIFCSFSLCSLCVCLFFFKKKDYKERFFPTSQPIN